MNINKILSALFILIYLIIPIRRLICGWERTYGTVNDEVGSSLVINYDGGYLIAGRVMYMGTGDKDFYIVRTDSLGDTLWTRAYGGVNVDVGFSVFLTSDSGYIVVGHTTSFGMGESDIWILKLDEYGDTIWTKVYGGISYDDGREVLENSEGNYIVAGIKGTSGSEGSSQAWLLKLDSEGDTIWTMTYGGGGWDDVFSMDQTKDGGYVLTGWTTSFGVDYYDVHLIKTDSDGNEMWTKTYGGYSWDLGRCVRETEDGNLIIVGKTSSWGRGNYDIYIIRTDEYGDTLWTRTYGYPSYESASDVIELRGGGFVIVGTTEMLGESNDQVFLLRVDEYGDTLWTRMFGGMWPDFGLDVAQTRDGGFIIAGRTESYGEGQGDFYLIKTDSLGYTDWIQEIPIHPENISINVYPNPFNSSCKIEVPTQARIQIYDLTGREIVELPPVKEYWQPGDNITSGMFIIKATLKEKVITQKVLYLK